MRLRRRGGLALWLDEGVRLAKAPDPGPPDARRAELGKLHGRRWRSLRDPLAPSRRRVRVIDAVQIGTALWVIHAFKKKSKTGIKTPQMEVDLIRERLKRLKEALK